MDWSKIPDLLAVALLACAFASVARRSPTRVSAHWLSGWLLILLHFAASMFAALPGDKGLIAETVALLALVWAGILFTRASVPYREEISSRVMLGILLVTNSIFLSSLILHAPHWVQTGSAALIGLAPLAVALAVVRRFQHPLRWITVSIQLAVSVVLLDMSVRSSAVESSEYAVLFSVYFLCSVHFLFMYRRPTAGAIISTSGFFLWAAIFLVAPFLAIHAPSIHIENEVWNLPKYVVAFGMILLLLEDQISHNKYLALHDELTGLPNRRLFQDRLAGALERARRTNSKTALIIVDLDHFKQVNDNFGHHAGDILLQKVATLLNGRVRRSDTVARTGGDEFAVVLEGPTSRLEANRVSANLFEMLKAPMKVDNFTMSVGASFGVAVFPDDAEDAQSLCIAADLRMYNDKRSNEGKQENRSPDASSRQEQV